MGSLVSVKIEIAPGLTCKDWDQMSKTLDQSGAWSQQWGQLIQHIKERFQSRFLEPAATLEKTKYAGFAVLALDCLLIESLQAFKSGRHATDVKASRQAYREFLRNSSRFRSFFPNDAAVDSFYKNVRNGLLHDGETRKGWLIKTNDKYYLIDYRQQPFVIINRKTFHRELVAEFTSHFEELRKANANAARANLYKAVEGLCRRSRP